MSERLCAECGGPMAASLPYNALYCGPPCKHRAYAKRRKAKAPPRRAKPRPKPRPKATTKREPAVLPQRVKAARQELEVRARQRREQLQARLDGHVARVVREWKRGE